MNVFFLSDYGSQDEFVGVVHAVLVAAAPGVTVIDMMHEVPPFDVRAGAASLARAAPWLGPGVVLAVVDPGVGSSRRGVCLEVAAPPSGPRFLVGPDNGLLIMAAELLGDGPVARAVVLSRGRAGGGEATTFDGRDLFAPAVAALCRGVPVGDLGEPTDPDSLVRLPVALVEPGRLGDGRRCLRAEVTWVDRFGNVLLAATRADARAAGLPEGGTVTLGAATATTATIETTLRRVSAFAELAPHALGLLVDANGHLAVVAGEASAARRLGIGAGDLVVVAW